MLDSNQVARRFIKKALDDQPAESKAVAPVPVTRLVDLMTFSVAFDAFIEAMSEKQVDPVQTATKGLALFRRFAPELSDALNQHLAPLLDNPAAGVMKPAFHRALMAGAPNTKIHLIAHFIKVCLPWMRSHSSVMQDTFPSRSGIAAKSLAAACMEQAPASRLNKLAAIAPVSTGLVTLRRWTALAAEEAGVPLRPIEGALADATVAKGLGEDLKKIDVEIATSDPNTQDSANLQSKRTQILDEIQKVADGSGDPQTVMATAVSAATTTQMHATEIGKRLGHTPDQEAAMMARGRALIAAGAGSGKTRVLASQVAYHINELGVPASSVMATSFTRKASAELMKRVAKYGAVIEGPASDGFGTTHSICGNILNKRAREFRKVSYMGREEGWKQTTLLRLAMEQVKMAASGGQTPPEPKSLWADAYVPDGGTQTQQGIPPQAQEQDVQFRSAIREAMGYFQWAARTWPGERARWATKAVSMLQSVQGKSVIDLRSDQKQAVNEIFAKVKVRGEYPIKYRIAAFVSRDDDEPDPNDAVPLTKRHNKLDAYTYFKTPARQWFNLGHSLTKEIQEAAQKGGKKGEIGVPVGEFKNAISILKGRGLSPSEAWADSPFGKHSDKAAVYAAYEWLKSPKGEAEFAGQGDMDDILIDTVRALVGSPTLRHQIQAQYKVLLIDESQDLNSVQHKVFGLMAGYLDPKTLQPHKDGHMTADTFALIGDDKQCLDKNSLVLTPYGNKPLYEVQKGDLVIAYRNGKVVEQTVKHAVPSSWTWGFKVALASGKTLTMSSNHKLWATSILPENPTLQLLAHTPEGSLVSIVTETNEQSQGTVGCFENYREALAITEKLSADMETKAVKLMQVAGQTLLQMTAAGLELGMSLPVLDETTIVLDPIVSIEKVTGEFIDLDVEDASNFFANQVLTSNSIFEFRGAEPEEFISRSDKVPDKETGKVGDFATKLLDTNFRSGSDIVDTANKLISYNKRQVPMVCKATPEKGTGHVISRQVDSVEEAAMSVADEIDELTKAGHIDPFDPKEGAGGFASFGIAVRSNAEAYDYGVEMLKRGIPFKSNASFFGDPNTKALIGWLTIAEHGLDGPADMVNEAVRVAVKAPFSKLGQAFFTKLEQKAKGPWPKWLVNGGYEEIYDWDKWTDILKTFTDNLEKVSKMKGSPSEIMEKLLQLKGIDGETMEEALIHSVEENDEIMSQLAAESETGSVSEDAIIEQALAPIKPLRGLLGGKEDLGDAMAYVRKLQAVNARISSKDTAAEVDRDAVTIGTMHSWKGLEVPRMYVPMVGGKFPRTNQEGVAEENPALWSERRLAYVAITRAEQQCTILDIPHPKMGYRSQFIQEGCVRHEQEIADAGAAPLGKVGSFKPVASWNRAAILSFLDQAARLKIDEWIQEKH